MEGGGGTFPEPRTWGKTSPSSFSTHQEGLRPKTQAIRSWSRLPPKPPQAAATILPSSLLGRESEAFPLWPDCGLGPSTTPF